MTHKKLLALLGSVCLILVLAAMPFMAACAPEEVPPPPEDGEEPPPPPPPEKSVLRGAWIEMPPSGRNALMANAATDWGWATLFYEPLWIPTLAGDHIPWLAKSWEYKEGEKAWIIYLDERATWSDGQPVTAEDVKFSFETCMEYNFTAGGPLKPFVDSIQAVDEKTVRFNMKKDYVHFLMEVGFVFIVPEHIWGQHDDISLYEDPYEGRVGSGPFLYKELKVGQYLHVVKDPNYWRGPVAIDEVVYQIYTNEEAMFMAMMKGEIDMISNIRGTFGAIPLLEADPDINFVQLPGPYTLHLASNERIYPLGLKEVRQAISIAVDRRAICDTAFMGFADYPLMGFLPPCYSAYANTDLTWPGLDMTEEERIAEADAILDDLGFKLGKDGIWVTDKGTKMEFDLVMPNWPDFIRTGEMIKLDLEKVGIGINVLPLDPGALYPGLVYNPERPMDWDLMGPHNSTVKGVKYYCAEFGAWGDPPNPWANAVAYGFQDDELQPLLTQINTTMDEEKRIELMMEAQVLFAKILPTIPLGHKAEIYAYRTDKFTGWDDTHIMQGGLTFPTCSLLNLTSLRPK